MKIQPDVRRQLEADIAFVQGMAGLYVSWAILTRAIDLMNRVEDFYLLRRAAPPAGMEIQHAWLLYNIKDGHGLYPVLLRLDARQDLTAAQRQEVCRTSGPIGPCAAPPQAMDNGYILVRGVEILQAASEEYPDNLDIRRAVAGAYTRVGPGLGCAGAFQDHPHAGRNSGDYQGAIGAALAATDMAQAEAWLRLALGLFPNDPQILELAARFEQARGNNQRATDFWRAALAAMPPGSAIQSLESGLVYPPERTMPPRRAT